MDRVKNGFPPDLGLLLLGVGTLVSGALKFSPRVYIAPEWPLLGGKWRFPFCQTCLNNAVFVISEWHSEEAQTCEE